MSYEREPLSMPSITLRDWFAGQALTVTASADYGNDWGKSGKAYATLAARRAYALADAMMEARKGTSHGKG